MVPFARLQANRTWRLVGAATMAPDYRRHGTTTLVATLDVKSGLVIGECQPRHRTTDFLRFLRRIDRTVKKRCQSYATSTPSEHRLSATRDRSCIAELRRTRTAGLAAVPVRGQHVAPSDSLARSGRAQPHRGRLKGQDFTGDLTAGGARKYQARALALSHFDC